MKRLKNEEEFARLIFPISQKAYDALEEDVFDNGCMNPIRVWNGIIIDGRKRYEICAEWEIPFRTVRMNFCCMAEAGSWICKSQLKRADIPDAMRRYLIGKYYGFEMERRKAARKAGGPERRTHIETAEAVGRELKFSSDTIRNYGAYAKAVDRIFEKDGNFAEKILSGKLKISRKSVIHLSGLSKEAVLTIDKSVSERHADRLEYREISHRGGPPSSARDRSGGEGSALIKKMPEYDPDAEISGLTLTIPSWISSIGRTASAADFKKATAGARRDLMMELFALQGAAISLMKSMEEAETDE